VENDLTESQLSRGIVELMAVEIALGRALQMQTSYQDSMNKMTLAQFRTLLGERVHTAKLGYTKLSNNELPGITNKIFPFFNPKFMITTITDLVLLNSGYIKQIWSVPSCFLFPSLTVPYLRK
jgi:hypothetical protein